MHLTMILKEVDCQGCLQHLRKKSWGALVAALYQVRAHTKEEIHALVEVHQEVGGGTIEQIRKALPNHLRVYIDDLF